MSIDAELVLPPDVQIIRVGELSPDVRSKIDALDEDFTITREHSRTPSSVVDKDSAELLESFRTPRRIVDAVLAYAAKRGLDPQTTLEQVYPLLSRLHRRQLLVPAGSDAAQRIEGQLRPGRIVNGFRLIRWVQVSNDNEVLLARDGAGRYAAVKFYRAASQRAIRSLEREAEMLGRVREGRAPKVFGMFHLDGGVGLATEWVAGADALVAANGLRGDRVPSSEGQLLQLCADVAAAFADVHESGLLHGDVHSRNVLIERSGRVRLIDFGLAREIESLTPQDERGGVPFYFDPEFAQAQRMQQLVPASRKGEQYSVAALLYQLWTGVHYLDWRLERDELLRQIVEDEPISFQARRVSEWPELEATLRRALQKNPGQRFPDLRALTLALTGCATQAKAPDRRTSAIDKASAPVRDLLERVLRRYQIGGEVLRNGPPGAPRASINYGAAGIAYALLRIAQRRSDPRLLALADVWSQRAYSLAASDDAFYNENLGIDRKTVGERSLFHSPAGLHCVRALISAAQSDAKAANLAIHAFIEHSRGANELLESGSRIDAVLGRCSLLLGCAEMIETVPDMAQFELASVRARGDEIEREVLRFFEEGPIESTDQLTTLGIAHGWGGIAFALLRWQHAIGRAPSPALCAKLDELGALAEPDATGVRWPVERDGASFWDGWCNGSAGYAMLYALAHRALGDSRFGDLAERAAISAWNSELAVGTLCCGQGGIGYALLAVHRITGSQQWLHRAHDCARRAAADNSPHFLPDALYKGAVGVALLAEELSAPESAAMPLFEPLC